MLAFLLAFSYLIHARDVLRPPNPPVLKTWSAEAPRRETLTVQTRDGIQLRGWLYKTDRRGAPYVLFFYGNNDDMSHEEYRLSWLRDTFHINAICFDYPGYGFSGGSVNIAALQSTALQEFDFTRSHVIPSTATPIFSYGWSIGAGVAIHVAAERKTAGLILQAPPASSQEMTKWVSERYIPQSVRGFVKLEAEPAVKQLFDNAAAIHTVAAPLLIIQGELDDVVPLGQGREVLDASPATRKRFVMVPGAHHNDLNFAEPPASVAVREFLRTFSAGKSGKRSLLYSTKILGTSFRLRVPKVPR